MRHAEKRCNSCRGATRGGGELHRRFCQCLRRRSEVAHLTMELFGVIGQLAGGHDALSVSTKIHMTLNKTH